MLFRSPREFYRAIDVITRDFNWADFEIGNIEADNAFKELLNQVKDEMEIKLDIANAGDYVPQAERNICTINGRV